MAEVSLPISPQTGAEAPPAPTERPDNVPEKFWNAETNSVNTDALLTSYGELEKLNSAAPPEGETKPEGTTPTPEGEGAAAQTGEALVADLGLPENLAPFVSSYQETGEVSETDYAGLAKLGYSKEVVDQFVAGAVAQAEAANPNTGFTAQAGSPERMNEIAGWASNNVPQGDIDLFNKASAEGSPEAQKMWELIQLKYEAANGKPAATRVSGSPTPAKTTGYYSMDDQMKDMKSPEYQTSPEFRAQVAARIAATVGRSR